MTSTGARSQGRPRWRDRPRRRSPFRRFGAVTAHLRVPSPSNLNHPARTQRRLLARRSGPPTAGLANQSGRLVRGALRQGLMRMRPGAAPPAGPHRSLLAHSHLVAWRRQYRSGAPRSAPPSALSSIEVADRTTAMVTCVKASRPPWGRLETLAALRQASLTLGPRAPRGSRRLLEHRKASPPAPPARAPQNLGEQTVMMTPGRFGGPDAVTGSSPIVG